MKSEWKRRARVNGQKAKVKARRLVLVMKLYQTKGGNWLRLEAANLARAVDYHLRQAHLLGRYVERLEDHERQALKLARQLDSTSRSAPASGAQGKA